MPLFVMGVVCLTQAIPVFATPTYKTVTLNFTTGDNAVPMYIESDDICMPLYVYYTGLDIHQYTNGIVQFTKPQFNFKLNNNSTISYSYFEPILVDGLQLIFPSENDNVCKLYFDNHNAIGGVGNLHLVGYFHFSSADTGTYTIEPTFTNISALISYQNVQQDTAPVGFVASMVEAINNSANIDDMLTLLDMIGGQSGYLPEILATMQANHTALYNLINNVWLTDQSVLSVSQNTYTTVLSILNALNNIDDTLDTITWRSVNTVIESTGASFGTLNTELTSANPFFMKINSSSYNGLLHLRVNMRSNNLNLRNYIKCTFLGRDYTNNLIDETEIYIYTYNGSYVDFYINNVNYGRINLKLENIFGDNINLISYTLAKSEYISTDDIEYWQILNSLRTGKIERILSEQYASQVEQADIIKDEVDTNLENLANDIAVMKPSQVANIADDYITQIDTSHNYEVFGWLKAPTIILMMCIVAGLAVISYMLYGGQ